MCIRDRLSAIVTHWDTGTATTFCLSKAPTFRGDQMPIATPEIYVQMLDKAKRESFAYPAINVSSSQTLHAALQGFAEAESDGIIQISTGGAEYLSGPMVKNMVAGL